MSRGLALRLAGSPGQTLEFRSTSGPGPWAWAFKAIADRLVGAVEASLSPRKVCTRHGFSHFSLRSSGSCWYVRVRV